MSKFHWELYMSRRIEANLDTFQLLIKAIQYVIHVVICLKLAV